MYRIKHLFVLSTFLLHRSGFGAQDGIQIKYGVDSQTPTVFQNNQDGKLNGHGVLADYRCDEKSKFGQIQVVVCRLFH